jgi:hypothetical protein
MLQEAAMNNQANFPKVKPFEPENAAQRATLTFWRMENAAAEALLHAAGPAKDRAALTGLVLLTVGMVALLVALVAGIKAGLRILDTGLSSQGVPLMMVNLITIAMAYFFGWVATALSTRVYRVPLAGGAVKAFSWLFLACLLALYLFITIKLFEQNYTDTKLLAYWLIMALGVLGLAGIHLITGTGDMRAYAFFLMLVSILHLGVIVYHYNFLDGFKPSGLIPDMLFFINMLLVEFLMLAHFGLLRSTREFLDRQFLDVRARMDLSR